jgi:hypothetical protein
MTLARIRVFPLLAAGAVVAGTLGAAGPALATQGPATVKLGYAADAFGTEVSVAGVVKSGRSALSTLGCTDETGIEHENSVASVGVPGLLTSGTVSTTAASEQTSTGSASSSSATTEGASLLGGLVAATTVESVSTTSRTNGKHKLGISAAGTEFLGLSVAGIPISGTPAPNTRITLPGVGYVVLNQQTGNASAHRAHLTVIGIHVVVDLTTPLAPAGTQIIVSDATSSLGGPISGLLSGLAYGASANVANTIIAGREFPESLGCLGTSGVPRTNGGVAVNIPGILSTGTVTDTVQGTDNSSAVSGEASSTVQGLNLLAGTVTATAIKADVTASSPPTPPTKANHSTFLGLSVAGFPGISDNVAPNTKLSLAGLGTLWLNRQIKTTDKITVIMVQLDVTVPSNPLGLQPGTVVNIAYASVGIK